MLHAAAETEAPKAVVSERAGARPVFIIWATHNVDTLLR
jgi:hypothetical protein